MKPRLKNRMVEGVEIAPDGCVVCHEPKPDTEKAPPGSGWAYLAGSTPVGALVCSTTCMQVAAKRNRRTGRVDTPDMRQS